MTEGPDPRWAEFSDGLGRVLELPEAEASAWLAELRGRDPALAKSIEDALKVRASAGYSEFLAGASPLPAGHAVAHSLIGRRVGPYLIDAELGRGGMGTVWRARRADGRYEGTVAIKFVHAAWIGQDGDQRFRTEGRLLGHLDHRNIARLLDAGVLEGVQPYLVLEFVEGEPIDADCDRRRLGIAARITLFLDVLAAVTHAHSQLIVHRDIKPTNVFVNREGVVKLLDFGIAKMLDREPGAPAMTKSAVAPFTLKYAAPEQLLGRPISTATDVYSLGALLYVLLTGTHPNEARSQPHAEFDRWLQSAPAPRASLAALAHAKADDDGLVDPEVRAAVRNTTSRQLARTLHGDLDNIIARAMAPLAEERYLSTAEFAADLRRFLTHEPVSAHSASASYRLRKLLQRRPFESALVGVIVVAVAVGLGATLWQWRVAEARRLEATRQRERAEQMLARTLAANDFTSSLLTQMAQVVRPIRFADVAKRGEELALRGGGDPVQKAHALLALAQFHVATNEDRHGRELAQQAAKLARQGGDLGLAAIATCVEGTALAGAGEADAADALAARGLDLAGDDAEAIYRCYEERGHIAASVGRYPEALAFGQRALAVSGGLPWISARERAGLLDLVGYGESHTGNLARGEDFFRRALEELDRAGLSESQEAVEVLVNVGFALERRGQLKSALEVKERALAIDRAILGDDGVSVGLWNNSARALLKLNRLDEAAVRAKTGLEAAARAQDDVGLFVGNVAMGGIRGEQKRFVEAQKYFDEGHRHTGQEKPGSAIDSTIRFAETVLLYKEGKYAQVLPALEALRADQNAYASRTGSRSVIAMFEIPGLTLRTTLLTVLGRHAEAVQVGEQAVDAARKAQGQAEVSADTGYALLVLAEARAALEGRSAVQALAQEAEHQLASALGPDHPRTRRAQALLGRPPG